MEYHKMLKYMPGRLTKCMPHGKLVWDCGKYAGSNAKMSAKETGVCQRNGQTNCKTNC